MPFFFSQYSPGSGLGSGVGGGGRGGRGGGGGRNTIILQTDELRFRLRACVLVHF